jgi:hypothetical protein
MGRPPIDRNTDLLYVLNQIADMAIGNEDPVDVGINELSTLPEMLVFITVHPTNLKALMTTEGKLKELHDKVQILQDIVYILKKRVHLKTNKI